MTFPKVIRGKAWKFGANIDTDQIIPAKYAIYSFDEKKLGEHALEGVPDNEGWAERVSDGDILVAGSNFGCGSSREIAPVAIRGAGISCVIADSYARIFFRNSINVGLPIVECREIVDVTEEGDEIEVDLATGTVRNLTKGITASAVPFPDFMRHIIEAGGLVPYLHEKLTSDPSGSNGNTDGVRAEGEEVDLRHD